MLLRIIFTYLCLLPSLSRAGVFEPLTANLTTIGANYNQGQLLPYEPGWEGIVGGDDDSSTPRAIVAAREFNQGRVFAVAGNGFFVDPAGTDNMKLMENAVDWLAAGKGIRVGLVTGNWEPTGVPERWRQRGYLLSWVPQTFTLADLTNYDVLIMGSTWDEIPSARVQAMRTFVANGGGLLLEGLGWSFPRANHTYPINVLGAEFGISWGTGVIDDPTNNFGLPGAPRFQTFYPNVRLSSLEKAFDIIRESHALHPTGFESLIENDAGLRGNYLRAHLALATYASQFPAPHPALDKIDAFCTGLLAGTIAANGPLYYNKARVYNTETHSVMATIRERFYRTWKDAAGHTAGQRQRIAELGNFPPLYREIFVEHGVYLMDNSSLDQHQLTYLRSLLALVPPQLHDLSVGVFHGFLSKTGAPWPGLPAELEFFKFYTGRAGAVSLDGSGVLEHLGNQFPEDAPPAALSNFCGVAVHELNHVVQAFFMTRSERLAARHAALISAAGDQPINYLRSMIPAGVFVNSPQEFFASISNEWFADSVNTFVLGFNRFDAGHYEPLNQAVFFADVYSGGGNQSFFYRTTPEGALVRQTVSLQRDGNGNIKEMDFGEASFKFTLNAAGDVMAYEVRTPAPVTLRPFLAAERKFEFSFVAESAAKYQVESSVNLIQWDAFSTLEGTAGAKIISDTMTGAFPDKFYRVLRVRSHQRTGN